MSHEEAQYRASALGDLANELTVEARRFRERGHTLLASGVEHAASMARIMAVEIVAKQTHEHDKSCDHDAARQERCGSHDT